MDRYTLQNGETVLYMGDSVIPSENSVVFRIQVFKESGKFYTEFFLILEKYTKEQVEKMQTSKDESERTEAYNIISDVIGFLKNDRPFFKDMTLVVNCDTYFPILIHGE